MVPTGYFLQRQIAAGVFQKLDKAKLPNLVNAWPALSDPFGWGWNLFGTASVAWQPALSSVVGPLQSMVLAGGLLWSANSAQKLARKSGLRSVPIIVFLVLATIFMAWLLI